MVLKWPFMRQKISKMFLQNCKNPDTKIFVFYVIAFDSIKIKTGLGPQSDN